MIITELGHPPLTQRQYLQYVLSLLPSAALINMIGALLAAAFIVPWSELGQAIIACQIVGYCMLAGPLLLRWVREFLPVPPWPMFAGHMLIGVPAGFFAGRELVIQAIGRDILHLTPHAGPAATLAVAAGTGLFGTMYFTIRWRIAGERWRGERAERVAVQARLRALQAQVEPHFLFNTLANLDALISRSPEDARLLIGHLNRYLGASLAHCRDEETTLDTEFRLLEAYLRIMAIRLPDRLRAHVDCPEDCRSLPFPPMLLHPLVENAVIHGIEPSIDGGEITLRAWRDPTHLHIELQDSGVGIGNAPPNPASNGTGLANVRERLEALYCTGATLRLEPNLPRGTRILISIQLGNLLAPHGRSQH